MPDWKQRALNTLNWLKIRWLLLSGWIRLHPKLCLAGFGAVVGLAVVASVAWYVLQPRIVVTPDVFPFRSMQEYEEFIASHPLLKAEEPEGSPFQVSGEITNDRRAEYTVKLFAPALKPNNPESTKQYVAALQQSQQAALDWFSSIGEPMDDLYVQWLPNPDVLPAEHQRSPIPQKHPGTSNTPTPVPTSSGRFPQ